MTRYRHKKQSVLPLVLITLLCLSLLAGKASAATGCSASCCVGSQMDGHGHTTAQIIGDFPCPCCSATVACATEKNFPPMTLGALHHDGKRAASPPVSGAPTTADVQLETNTDLSSAFTAPPVKVPIYIATLNLLY
jgi:hypothetical protein